MFFKNFKKLDIFEDTAISNVFIDFFMPSATAEQIKVYIFGYKSALNLKEGISNQKIANTLNMKVEEVVSCWQYWDQKSVVKIHNISTKNPNIFGVEFLNLKEYYLKNYYSKDLLEDDIDETDIDDEFSGVNLTPMFDSIEGYVGRLLSPSEKINILDIKKKYFFSPEIVVLAFKTSTKDGKGFKSIKYIEAILKSWYDNSLKSIDEIEIFESKNFEKFAIYKRVFKSLGFSFRQPTEAEQNKMDIWFSTWNMPMELVLLGCSKTSGITNPSINYVHATLEKWFNAGVKTVDELQKYEEDYLNQKKAKKQGQSTDKKNYKNVSKKPNSFHNFKGSLNERFSTEEEFLNFIDKIKG